VYPNAFAPYVGWTHEDFVRHFTVDTATGHFWPFDCNADVATSYAQRLLPAWYDLKYNIDNCPGFDGQPGDSAPAGKRLAFMNDFADFTAWVNIVKSQPCDADALIRQGQEFETRLSQWQTALKNVQCVVSDPPLPALPDTDPRSPNYRPPPSSLDQIEGITKLVILGACVVGGIWILGPALAKGVSHVTE